MTLAGIYETINLANVLLIHFRSTLSQVPDWGEVYV